MRSTSNFKIFLSCFLLASLISQANSYSATYCRSRGYKYCTDYYDDCTMYSSDCYYYGSGSSGSSCYNDFDCDGCCINYQCSSCSTPSAGVIIAFIVIPIVLCLIISICICVIRRRRSQRLLALQMAQIDMQHNLQGGQPLNQMPNDMQQQQLLYQQQMMYQQNPQMFQQNQQMYQQNPQMYQQNQQMMYQNPNMMYQNNPQMMYSPNVVGVPVK